MEFAEGSFFHKTIKTRKSIWKSPFPREKNHEFTSNGPIKRGQKISTVADICEFVTSFNC